MMRYVTNLDYGRNLTTGKYSTREELVINARRLRELRGMSYASIARCCQVSPATIKSILVDNNQ